MKQIVIKFIAQEEQRIGEPADWWFDENGDLQVRVTDLGDWRYNALVAEHELDEALGCKRAGITTEAVDKYCLESTAPADPDSFSGYPGSPHQRQHNDALALEWIRARMLGVDWDEYAKAFSVFWDPVHPESAT